MSRINADFFATPDEQLGWLEGFLADNDIWCVLRILPPMWRIEQVHDKGFLTTLPLRKADGIGGLQLFFGRRDLVPAPMWRTPENGDRDIDFIRSQAIQYSPSIVVGEHVLLEGQMGIMRRSHYEKSGIDPNPVNAWFNEVASSFARLGTGIPVTLRDTKSGQERVYKDIIVSFGALEWQRSGHLLKQFLNGAYEFHVVPSEKSAERP